MAQVGLESANLTWKLELRSGDHVNFNSIEMGDDLIR